MKDKKKVSRFESNKKVRQVLARNQTDIPQLSFSCSGKMLRVGGLLMKIDGSDFSSTGIEGLQNELTSIDGVDNIYWEVENWEITPGSIKKVEKDKKKKNKNKH